MTDAEPGLYGTPGRVEDEVATVRAIYDAFARRDVEAALKYIADDCELHVPGTSRLTGRTEPYRGPDGVRQYFADVSRVWSELDALRRRHPRLAGRRRRIRPRRGKARRRDTSAAASCGLWTVENGKAVTARANDLGETKHQA